MIQIYSEGIPPISIHDATKEHFQQLWDIVLNDLLVFYSVNPHMMIRVNKINCITFVEESSKNSEAPTDACEVVLENSEI